MNRVDLPAMRASNRGLLIDLLRSGGRLSRVDLARRSGMTKPGVSAIVEDLLQEDLVREVGLKGGGIIRGRPARLLELNPLASLFLGIDFRERETAVSLADANGKLLAIRPVRSNRDPLRAAESVNEAADELFAASKTSRRRLRSAAAAIHGLVDRASGTCILAPNLEWRDVPVRDLLTRVLGVPADIMNVMQLSALAEHRAGAARHERSFLWIYFGFGIGAGMILDGQLVTGQRGFAGELGHFGAVDNGLPCGCGKRGCIETVASWTAILRAAENQLANRPRSGAWDVAAIDALARHGDAGAAEILDTAMNHLARGIAHAVDLLDLRLIVIGGEGDAGEYTMNSLRAALEPRVLRPAEVQVVHSSVGPDIALVGAAGLAMSLVHDASPSQRVAREVSDQRS